ncbi:contact-dependent growth inhibition system immunity protein [Sphingomonas sp. LHG3406-1]|uniref:contact-dependent growth inhibition system immunity protein n=1 Tax=Sphingomonas sp. LHG3406-1 TaxID=2804617 RepID=UPI002607F316|nr:contact-dependent growth inhibition system immunity protein [Sphingomonas sp. LHG3406-1]
MQTDFSKSLEDLFGVSLGDPQDAPSPLVAEYWIAWRKPLSQLSDTEIGLIIGQEDGNPFILDLVWPRLRADPLLMCGDYPGDVLSALLRADESIWNLRAAYRDELKALYERALLEPYADKEWFLESLGLSDGPLH